MKEYKCKICDQEFDNPRVFANHYRWKHKEKKEFKCRKCNKIFSDKSSYSNHIKTCNGIKKPKQLWICPKCGFEIKSSREKHLNICDGKGPRRRREKSGHTLKGKTYEELYGIKEAKKRKEKLSNAMKGFNSWDKMSDEMKLKTQKKLKNAINKRYDEGWDPKAGRAKKYKYKDFTVDGSWELEFCKWGDNIGLIYERNLDRFEYEFEGINRKYKPDFKLNENLYVEIKGYQTDKDDAKWEQFPHNLIVLKRSQIDRIKKRTFKLNDLYRYKL